MHRSDYRGTILEHTDRGRTSTAKGTGLFPYSLSRELIRAKSIFLKLLPVMSPRSKLRYARSGSGDAQLSSAGTHSLVTFTSSRGNPMKISSELIVERYLPRTMQHTRYMLAGAYVTSL